MAYNASACFSLLGEMPALEYCDLSAVQNLWTSGRLIEVLRAPGLKGARLISQSVQFTPEFYAALAQCKNLEYIEMAFMPLSDLHCGTLAKLDKLHTVRLYGSRVTGKGLLALAALPALRWVDMSYCDTIEDDDMLAFTAKRPDVYFTY